MSELVCTGDVSICGAVQAPSGFRSVAKWSAPRSLRGTLTVRWSRSGVARTPGWGSFGPARQPGFHTQRPLAGCHPRAFGEPLERGPDQLHVPPTGCVDWPLADANAPRPTARVRSRRTAWSPARCAAPGSARLPGQASAGLPGSTGHGCPVGDGTRVRRAATVAVLSSRKRAFSGSHDGPAPRNRRHSA